MPDKEMPEVAVAEQPIMAVEAPATAEATPTETTPTEQHPAPTPSPRRRRPPRPRGNYPPVEVIPPQKIVRKLAVGMEMEGKVKRLAEFGAFIDIGVGRDGLVHVSEVSIKRVTKIGDVLKEGDTVKVWIKELDRDKNRISLTMIAPGTRTVRDLQEGDILTGTITRIVPYGAFIDIGVERDGMLHVREMAKGYVEKPEDVVKIGDTVEVRISQLDRRRQRIDLSMKGLQPEPEPEQPASRVATGDAEGEAPVEEEVNVIEFALQKAENAKRRERRERHKEREREPGQRELDDIISRTLRMHRGEDD